MLVSAFIAQHIAGKEVSHLRLYISKGQWRLHRGDYDGLHSGTQLPGAGSEWKCVILYTRFLTRDKTLALTLVANLHSIPGTTYGFLSPPGVILRTQLRANPKYCPDTKTKCKAS